MSLPLTLELDDGQLDALLAGARPDGVDGLPAGLEATMAELRDSPCELELQRGPRRGRGWVGPELTALVVPAGEDRWRLHVLPTDFVPEALARLNDLGPRPDARPASPLRLDPGALAQSVATGGRELGGAVREHWRVDALWTAPSGEVAGRSVEVLDTTEGLWLVTPAGEKLELSRVRPSEVFRRLCAVFSP